MKLQIFIDSLAGGGAERTTVALSSYLLEQGNSVAVVTLYPPERDFFKLDPGVNKTSLNLVATRSLVNKVTVNLRRILRLREMLRNDGTEIVIGMMTTCAVLSVLASLGLPTRVVVAERNYPGRKRLLKPWVLLRKFLYRFADGCVVQTREAGEWLERHVSRGDIHVIPNSVVWPIPGGEPSVDPDAWLPERVRCVLAAGTKVEQKGFDMLIDAFASVANDHPDWSLVVLGPDDGPPGSASPRDVLRRRAENAGIANRLCLPGLVGNVADWYERADMFVLSSRYEGFPNVLLEAMAAGCPPVSFDCDAGPRDIVENEVNGLLVPAANVEALAAGMRRLMTDEALRVRLAEQCVGVRSRFAETRILQRWNDVIRKTARHARRTG